METQKLKLKIGDHEFEAEGPVDVVQSQFAAWKELIAALPPKTGTSIPTSNSDAHIVSALLRGSPAAPDLAIEKIMKSDGRIVSLTARAENCDETALLILLGQKELRGNQEVTGSELMDGLRQSGYNITRADTLMDKLAKNGEVITIGVNRGRRYRLSNSGLSLANQIAQAVLETVP